MSPKTPTCTPVASFRVSSPISPLSWSTRRTGRAGSHTIDSAPAKSRWRRWSPRYEPRRARPTGEQSKLAFDPRASPVAVVNSRRFVPHSIEICAIGKPSIVDIGDDSDSRRTFRLALTGTRWCPQGGTIWRSFEIPTGAWWYLFQRGDIMTVTTQPTLQAVTTLVRWPKRRLGCCIRVKEAIARLLPNGIFNKIPIARPPSRRRVGEKKL